MNLHYKGWTIAISMVDGDYVATALDGRDRGNTMTFEGMSWRQVEEVAAAYIDEGWDERTQTRRFPRD